MNIELDPDDSVTITAFSGDVVIEYGGKITPIMEHAYYCETCRSIFAGNYDNLQTHELPTPVETRALEGRTRDTHSITKLW